MRRISLVLTVAVVLPFACDADPKDGLFGETAAGPSTPGSAGGSGGAADPDTEGGSDGARSDSEGSDGTGADLPPPPADDGDPPPPPPADEGGTFNPLDDGGTADAGDPTTSDGGVASTDDGANPPPPPPPAGDCCTAGVGVGCSDPALEACVCASDPFCCDTQWDAACVDGATACGAGCGGGAGGNCCLPQAGPGCGDAAIENCVCLIDAFCCTTQWDEICASEAQLDCGVVC